MFYSHLATSCTAISILLTRYKTTFSVAIIFAIIGFFTTSSTLIMPPIQAQGACGPGQIDMLTYFRGSLNDTNLTNDGQAKYEYFPGTADEAGRTKFFIIKSRNQAVFEEFSYDSQYIYHLKDTSWATGAGDVFCSDGNPAGFTLLDGHGGSGADIGTPKEGQPWVPRCMTPGQTFSSPTTVVAFDKKNCKACDAPYTGDSTRVVTMTIEDITFPSGINIPNAARLKILAGPGAGENYWYSAEHGWVAFGRDDNPASYVVGFDGPMDVSTTDGASGVFQCQFFDGVYDGINPILYQGQICKVGEQPEGRFTSRPAECASCLDYVPSPTRACGGNFTYQRNLAYTSFDTQTCNGRQCSLNAACGLELGGIHIPAVTDYQADQLIVGPKPWRGRFTFNVSETILPFAGNDTEESRERYIADYIDGTNFYKTPIVPASNPPEPDQDPIPIYTPNVQSYYDLPPTDPRYYSYAGVTHKLAPQEHQDKLKYQLLDRVNQANYATTFQPLDDYTIRNWAAEEAKLTDFNDLNRFRRRPLRSESSSAEEYLNAIAAWEALDGGIWARLWSYVPIVSRQDTPGEFVPEVQSPGRIEEVPVNNTGPVSQNLSPILASAEIFSPSYESPKTNLLAQVNPPDPVPDPDSAPDPDTPDVRATPLTQSNTSVNAAPTQVEMQLPHLARLFESTEIIFNLLKPADPVNGINNLADGDVCKIGGDLLGSVNPTTGNVTTPMWTNSTSEPLEGAIPLNQLLADESVTDIVTLSGTLYTVDPITYDKTAGNPADPQDIGLVTNICRSASSGCGGAPNAPEYELTVHYNGQTYKYEFSGNGQSHAHKTYSLRVPAGSAYEIVAGLSACYSETKTTGQATTDICQDGFVYAWVSNEEQDRTWCGVTDSCNYDRPRDEPLSDSGNYWAKKCGMPQGFWQCGAPPTVNPGSDCPSNPLDNGSSLIKKDTDLAQDPLQSLVASSEILSPSSSSLETKNQKLETRLLAQASSTVPPQCQTAIDGCFPSVDGGTEGCFYLDVQPAPKVENGVLHYCMRSFQTCSNVGGGFGDCMIWGNGGTRQLYPGLGVGAYGEDKAICSYYPGVDSQLVPLKNLTCPDSKTFTVNMECPNNGINPQCCAKTQSATCTVTVDADCNVSSPDCEVGPPVGASAPPVCAPTTLGTVSQCTGIIRTGPGDNMCGVKSFDLVIDAPDETFWNANPYDSVAVNNSGQQVHLGDGQLAYTNNICGAGVTCANCACTAPNRDTTLTGDCTTTIQCNGEVDNSTSPPTCPGGFYEETNCPTKCCAPSPDGIIRLNATETDCFVHPPGHFLCPNGGACTYDDETSACVALPYGADEVEGDDRNGTGADILEEYDKELYYPATREIRVTTNLPYLEAIYDNLIDNQKAVYKMFTPLRDTTTGEDQVPWYKYHDGNASGEYTISNNGPADRTFVNGAQTISRQPFYFPFLGGIQDGTQFIRDCLTATWPNGCTPPEVQDALTGKTCVANFSSKMSIYANTYDSLASQFVQTVNPSVIKLMGPALSSAADIPEEINIVGRIYSNTYDTNLPDITTVNPQDAAQEWFNIVQDRINSSTAVDYWEGYNEPVADSPEKMQWLAAFEARRVELLDSIGEQACIGNFSTGNPNTDYWPEFLLAFQTIAAEGGIICLHEYATPTTTVDGFRMGRFQSMYDYLDTQGLGYLRTIISETGATTDGASTGGWRVIFDNDEEKFLEILKEYDELIKGDERILGATIYIYGHPGWPNQEIGPDILQAMIDGESGASEGQVQCIQNTINNPLNENVPITKQAFINNNGNLTPVSGSIPNSQLPVTITYQVTISTKLSQLTNITLQNSYDITQDPLTAPNPNPPFPTPPADLIITPDTPYTFSYDHTFSNQYSDSLVTDTINLRSGAITSSGRASVIFGNPPQDCPSGWPVKNTQKSWTWSITQGPWAGYSHSVVNAIDIASGTSSWDNPIVPENVIIATHTGTVVVKNFHSVYGNQVRIEGQCNGQTITTIYGHMNSFANTYQIGDTITKGTILGVMGTTGKSDGIHVHYEFYPKRDLLYMRPPFLPRLVPDNSGYSGTFTTTP